MSREKLTGLGGRLREARGTMPQQAFAKRLGMKKQQYNRYEGGAIPSLPVLLKISEAMGASLDWLVTGDVQRQTSPDTNVPGVAQSLPVPGREVPGMDKLVAQLRRIYWKYETSAKPPSHEWMSVVMLLAALSGEEPVLEARPVKMGRKAGGGGQQRPAP